MDRYITLASLLLTPLTIFTCIYVAILWRRSAITSWREANKTSIQWFIIGVFISFVGSAVDNFYWGITWTVDFLNPESDLRESLFQYGPYSNLPFRQVTTSLAALCHLKAASEIGNSAIRTVIIISAVLTVAYVLFLLRYS